MKKYTLCLLVICVLLTAHNDENKKTNPQVATIFQYIGQAPITDFNELKKKANWQPVEELACDHNPEKICGVEILQNLSTYVDGNGTPGDITDDSLKVNVSGQFQNDILDAAGYDDVINEFVTTNYNIFNKSMASLNSKSPR